jgi:hypothetical protein
MPGMNDYRLLLVNEFDQVMLVAYSQVLYSIMESKFRLYQLTINPNALITKPDAFYHVHNWLLRDIRRKTKYRRLIRFFSLIRNTIHNNGKYWDKKEPNVRMKYKNKFFKFEHGKMVTYRGGAFTWLLLYITPDVIDMMEDIILKTKLIKIPSIPEPASVS